MTASLAFTDAEASAAPAARSGRPFVGREPEIEPGRTYGACQQKCD